MKTLLLFIIVISLTGCVVPQREIKSAPKPLPEVAADKNDQSEPAPELLSRKSPKMPFSAMRNMQDGWVQVKFNIDTAGVPTSVEVVDSSPAGVYDNAAKTAVKQWRYKPYELNGKPVVYKNHKTVMVFNFERG